MNIVKVIWLTVLGVVLGFTMLFGPSVLNNAHLAYLRKLGNSSVVMLHNSQGSGATGFIVKGKSGTRYVMTNGHVCGLEETIGNKSGIFVIYRGDEYFLQVYKRYQWNDLCAVIAPSTAKGGLKIARSFRLGETATAIGHPQLEPLSVSSGELSDTMDITVAVSKNVTADQCNGPTYTLHTLDTDLPPEYLFAGITSICTRTLEANTGNVIISPGNSGSPILNIWGRVIGVEFAANESGTRSYSVPLSDLQDFLLQL